MQASDCPNARGAEGADTCYRTGEYRCCCRLVLLLLLASAAATATEATAATRASGRCRCCCAACCTPASVVRTGRWHEEEKGAAAAAGGNGGYGRCSCRRLFLLEYRSSIVVHSRRSRAVTPRKAATRRLVCGLNTPYSNALTACYSGGYPSYCKRDAVGERPTRLPSAKGGRRRFRCCRGTRCASRAAIRPTAWSGAKGSKWSAKEVECGHG